MHACLIKLLSEQNSARVTLVVLFDRVVGQVAEGDTSTSRYPVASLPKLMIDAVQPEGIVMVEGSRNGFVDLELCDEEGADPEDDVGPNEDDVAGPAAPARPMEAPAVAKVPTDTTKRRRSTRVRK